MLSKDKITDLHNKVTEVHKITNAATTGRAAIDWVMLVGLISDVLKLVQDHMTHSKNDIKRSINEQQETAPAEAPKEEEPPKEDTFRPDQLTI